MPAGVEFMAILATPHGCHDSHSMAILYLCQPWRQQATGRRLRKAFCLWEMFSLVREWCNSARLLTVRDSLLVAFADHCFGVPLLHLCLILLFAAVFAGS